MNRIVKLYKVCRNSNTCFTCLVLKFVYYKLQGKNILAHQNTRINKLKNIRINGLLRVGIENVGFTHPKDITYLNIKGTLIINGNISIGRGCRFEVGKNAIVEIGNGTYINPFTKILIYHGLKIGNNCSISWDCQFLDEDFHSIKYLGRVENIFKSITIGNKVWIGSKVSIFKGTTIADGCVIASNSVVKGEFLEKNVLIAGSPAKVIKHSVSW
jgi:acetyltransferase-like isoleucine patch superfamily enzyme